MPPSHEIPVNILGSGTQFTSFRHPGHDVFFEDFRWFQTIMNRQTTDPWCIEEVADTHIRDMRADSPELGRRYRIYYNSCEFGSLQVHPSGMGVLDAERFKREREAWAILDLRYLRFIDWEDALNLVRTLYYFMLPFTEREASHSAASTKAIEALTGHLWDTMRHPDEVLDFTHYVSGPYHLVQQTTEHWASGGLDPIRDWGGDRSPPRERN